LKRRTKVLLWLLALAAGMFLFSRYVAKPFVVIGESMAPTLHSWDCGVMQWVRQYEPRRGDIVMFRTADDPPIHFIKRVIALPGETVAVNDGVIQINSVPLREAYSTAYSDWNLSPTNVPPGRVFVIGDNRGRGGYETWHGFVATRLVIGRLIWHWRWKS